MYGNAITCKSGFRLHAFRAVRATSLPEPSLFRNVILARGEGPQKEFESDLTGYSFYDEAWASGMAFFAIDTFSEDR
jgi:hypothetical protein